ncbi:hypothetical protein EDC96DRAFT_562115 [Choanephora cucurbitarum]|nr:hypothetical protein EDC96DRAFT_562115 [Choanephora cucurbitarum]
MNTVVYINAKKLTSIAGNRLKRTLDEAIDNSEESSSAIANGSAYDINETADKSSISSNFHDDDSTSTISEQIGHSPLTYSVLKKRIVEKADEIHSIVCCWFGFDVEQLRRISILITLVKAIIPIKSGYLVSSLFFFAINGNLIRVKKVETVPKDSTIEKSSLYSSNKHVIGFKTGIRFIFDYKESEFDIGGAEVCLPNADITKATDDEAELLREGKSIANSLNSVSSGDICFSWIVHISGLRASFSTVAYVGHDLHVGVLQN